MQLTKETNGESTKSKKTKKLQRKLRRRRRAGRLSTAVYGPDIGDDRNYGKHCKRKNKRGQCVQFVYQPNEHGEDQVTYYVVPDPVLRMPDQNENICDLQAELFPLYYTPILKSLTFRAAFTSNCMSKKDIQFEIYFHGKHQVNWNFHPTSLKLSIFGNEYSIKYKSPVPRDQFDIMRSLEYTTAAFTSINSKRVLDVQHRNETYLFPQINNTFTPYNIAKIQSSALINCQVNIEEDENNRKLAGVFDDYEIQPPREKGEFRDSNKTAEQKQLEKDINKVKEIQGLKAREFQDENLAKKLDIVCKIE